MWSPSEVLMGSGMKWVDSEHACEGFSWLCTLRWEGPPWRWVSPFHGLSLTLKEKQRFSWALGGMLALTFSSPPVAWCGQLAHAPTALPYLQQWAKELLLFTDFSCQAVLSQQQEKKLGYKWVFSIFPLSLWAVGLDGWNSDIYLKLSGGIVKPGCRRHQKSELLVPSESRVALLDLLLKSKLVRFIIYFFIQCVHLGYMIQRNSDLGNTFLSFH